MFVLAWSSIGWSQAPREEAETTAQHLATLLNVGRLIVDRNQTLINDPRKGDKGFTLTGQLGDVMRESATAALSYVRSKAQELGIDENAFSQVDIHLHIPAGSTPKDGPSAGVTLATALASLMMNKPVNGELGMTGEITLRGLVLPVGGIKEKILAAHRAGLKKVCLPRRNAKDLDELPEEVRNEMEFILVDRVEQVFAAAFGVMEGNTRVQSDTKQNESEQQ